jgi:alkylation response protein AidB-like acyl-CoA dehydrogenase
VTSIEQRDVESVLAGIDDLLPLIAKRAQATEDLRRLPDETVSELDEVGFFKLLQPEQWGGLQCDPTVFYEAVRRIATACGSTGWVSSIVGVHNWHLALFDQRAQEEVWGEDPTVRISSSYAPMGAGQVVEGGYLVNGSWNWSSGCDHATWTFVGGPVIKDGRPVDFGSFLIPRTEYKIDDVWHVVGLRGTGSNTLVVKDVFVPTHRFLSYKSMNDRTAGGLQTNAAPVYKMPWGTVHPTTISAPIVGMAYGAYDAQAGPRGVRRREGQGRSVRQGSHRRGGQRHRRRVAPTHRQRRRRVRAAGSGPGDPVRAACPRPSRPGPCHRTRHRVDRPALRSVRRHCVEQRCSGATVLARRARRPGARRQRPGTRLLDLRKQRVRAAAPGHDGLDDR